MTDEFRAWLAERLNAAPWVEWDRLAVSGDDVAVFGWIARPDGRSDFTVVTVQWQGLQARVGVVTSSSRYSTETAEAIQGDAEAHEPCLRVEDELPGVERAVRLARRLAE